MLEVWKNLMRLATLILFAGLGSIKIGLGVVGIMAGNPSFHHAGHWVLVLTGLGWVALGVYAFGFERPWTAPKP